MMLRQKAMYDEGVGMTEKSFGQWFSDHGVG
jgi:hypothetical protein